MIILICAVVILALSGLYIFIIFPRAGGWTDHQQFLQKPIAHRGIFNNSDVYENTLAAFAAACDAGYGIELDIRLTRDGVPVVIHDGSLKRVTGSDINVSDSDFAELIKYTYKDGVSHIPSLDEVLNLISGKVPVIFEIKDEGISSHIVDAVAMRLADYKGPFAIESFNPYYIYRIKKLLPDIPRGILIDGRDKNVGIRERFFRRISSMLIFNFLMRPDFLALKYGEKFTLSMRLCRYFGVKAVAWTIRSHEELKLAMEKYDGTICENIFDL